MKVLSACGALLATAMLFCALKSDDNVQPQRAAADPRPKPTLPKGTPADQVTTLIKQHDQATTAFHKMYAAAKTDEDLEKLQDLIPDPTPYAALLVQIAEQNAKDPAAIQALLWVVRNAIPTPRDADSPHAKAKGILIRDYLKHPKVGPLCMVLRREVQDAGTVQVIRRVLTDNPSKEAQAEAAFALAILLQQRAGWARNLENADPKELVQLETHFGKDNVAALRRGDAAALEKEAEELLERITKDKDYAAVSINYGKPQVKLGGLADRGLFQARHLQPGKPAPEIAGEDIDGKPMKLSDFRGRVVFLNFWGHW